MVLDVNMNQFHDDLNNVEGVEESVAKPEYTTGDLPKSGSKFVSKVLPVSIQLWLRTQLEKVEKLEVKIEGSNRQILQGSIPKVFLTAKNAIYQGLHFSDVRLSATDIRINIGQIIRGKPLRLLKPFAVTGQLLLQEADLNASFQSPLLANAAIEFLTPLLLRSSQGEIQPPISLDGIQLGIERDRLTLLGQILCANGAQNLAITTGIELANNQKILFQPLEVRLSSKIVDDIFNDAKIDLGSDVKIEELTLDSEKLYCRGEIMVNP